MNTEANIWDQLKAGTLPEVPVQIENKSLVLLGITLVVAISICIVIFRLSAPKK